MAVLEVTGWPGNAASCKFLPIQTVSTSSLMVVSDSSMPHRVHHAGTAPPLPSFQGDRLWRRFKALTLRHPAFKAYGMDEPSLYCTSVEEPYFLA